MIFPPSEKLALYGSWLYPAKDQTPRAWNQRNTESEVSCVLWWYWGLISFTEESICSYFDF